MVTVSVANIIVQPETVYMVTDSGVWSRDGSELVDLRRKEILIPGLPIAITAIGNVGQIFPRIQSAVENGDPEDFSFIAFMSGVRTAYEVTGIDPEEHGSVWIAVFYSAFTERAFGQSFFTSSKDGGKTRKPWEWYQERVSCMPRFELAEVFKVRKNLTDPVVYDPRTEVMDIVHAQRARRVGEADASPVAGEIWLTAVSAAGVEQTLLHDYGDVVGELAG